MNTLKTNWIGFKTLFVKEIKRFLRIWIQTILPSAITVTLYIVIFGSFIGSRILPIQGHSYLEYIIPGLIMMAVINNSYANVVSSFYGARFQKTIEEILISPLPNSLMLLGFVLGGVVRGILVALLVTGISMFFTHLTAHSILQMCIIAILSAALFSLAGFTNGLLAKNFDDTSFITTFVLTPLTYLGGIFYSIDLLPSFWRSVSLFNPILYIVNTFRYAILGVSDINVTLSFIYIVSLVVLLFIINLYMLKKGIGIRT